MPRCLPGLLPQQRSISHIICFVAFTGVPAHPAEETPAAQVAARPHGLPGVGEPPADRPRAGAAEPENTAPAQPPGEPPPPLHKCIVCGAPADGNRPEPTCSLPFCGHHGEMLMRSSGHGNIEDVASHFPSQRAQPLADANQQDPIAEDAGVDTAAVVPAADTPMERPPNWPEGRTIWMLYMTVAIDAELNADPHRVSQQWKLSQRRCTSIQRTSKYMEADWGA